VFSGFLPHPPEPEQGLAVVTDRRGEADDPVAASGLLPTRRSLWTTPPSLPRAGSGGCGSYAGRWCQGSPIQSHLGSPIVSQWTRDTTHGGFATTRVYDGRYKMRIVVDDQ
jgi:hypothetical protein